MRLCGVEMGNAGKSRYSKFDIVVSLRYAISSHADVYALCHVLSIRCIRHDFSSHCGCDSFPLFFSGSSIPFLEYSSPVLLVRFPSSLVVTMSVTICRCLLCFFNIHVLFRVPVARAFSSLFMNVFSTWVLSTFLNGRFS